MRRVPPTRAGVAGPTRRGVPVPRALVGVLVVGLVGALVAAAAGGPGTASAVGEPGARDADGVRPVGTLTRMFVDRSRRTPADVSAGIPPARERVLPTTIYYPARGSPGTVTERAKPARGRYPLVLFSPGAPGTPHDYEVLLADWAAHGYVVVAPTFPISSVAGPDAAAWKDLPAQTKDVRFVLDRVLALDPHRAGTARIDDERIAVAGHSFGGATALSLVSRCCRDHRFDAVVALAAVAETEHGPALKRPVGPILFVHAEGDRAVPYRDAAGLCRTAEGRRRFLTVKEIRGLRAHVDPYVGDDRYAAVVRPAIVDFLDGYLRGEAAARRRLDRAGAGTTVATMSRCPAARATPPTAPTTPSAG